MNPSHIRNSAALLMGMGLEFSSLDVTPPSSTEDEADENDAFQEYDEPPENTTSEENSTMDFHESPPKKMARFDFDNNDKGNGRLPLNEKSISEASSLSTSDTFDEEVLTNLMSVEVGLREWKRYFVCPECGIKVAYRNVSRHVKEKHSGLRIKCNLCAKEFLRKEYLERHLCKK